MIDLFTFVTTQTDFLSELPEYSKATDKTVGYVVDCYMEQASSMPCHDTRQQLFAAAWDEMLDRYERLFDENERASHPTRPEYDTYYNAN